MEASLHPPALLVQYSALQRPAQAVVDNGECPTTPGSGPVTPDGGALINNGPATPDDGAESVLSWKQKALTNLHVADPTLLRGMPANSVLRTFASVLSHRPPTAKYFDMSAQVTQFDTFLSHNWSTPRWRKFLVLIFHFNLRPALLLATLVGTGAAFLTVAGCFPVAVLLNPSVSGGSSMYTRGVLAGPLSFIAFIVALFSVHELERYSPWVRQHVVFLDKCCVHQVDVRKKELGIQSLAAFLQHSRHFLVLYSDVYMRQLWTIYEVASWMMLHKGTKVIARPVLAPAVVLSGCLCFAALEALIFAVNALRLSSSQEPVVRYLLPVQFLLMVAACTAWTCLGARWSADCDRIDKHVSEFSLQSARCKSEDDRKMVSQNILAFMKFAELVDPELGDDEVFRIFEGLVRREVPKLVRSSFGRVGVPLEWALLAALPRAMVNLDLIAGNILSSTPRHTLLEGLLYAAAALLVGPLLVAFSMTVTRIRRCRSLLACLGFGVIEGLVLYFVVLLFHYMSNWAEHSDRWLVGLLATYASLVATLGFVFRPVQ